MQLYQNQKGYKKFKITSFDSDLRTLYKLLLFQKFLTFKNDKKILV